MNYSQLILSDINGSKTKQFNNDTKNNNNTRGFFVLLQLFKFKLLITLKVNITFVNCFVFGLYSFNMFVEQYE